MTAVITSGPLAIAALSRPSVYQAEAKNPTISRKWSAVMSKYGHLPHNWFEAVLNKMGGEEQAERFLRGETEIVVKKHLIDLDADPFTNGNEITEHVRGGQFEWDPAKVSLFRSIQQSTGTVTGLELLEEMRGRKPFNACLLDYLFAHQWLIPSEWRVVFFWGTIFNNGGVGGIYRLDKIWHRGYFNLSVRIDPNCCAAVLAE